MAHEAYYQELMQQALGSYGPSFKLCVFFYHLETSRYG